MPTKTATLPASALLALCCQQAWAGGIMLYEIGTDNAGLANAGAAARAQGPSTIASTGSRPAMGTAACTCVMIRSPLV